MNDLNKDYYIVRLCKGFLNFLASVFCFIFLLLVGTIAYSIIPAIIGIVMITAINIDRKKPFNEWEIVQFFSSNPNNLTAEKNNE